MNLKNRNFLKLLDFTPEEVMYFIDHAAELKAMKKARAPLIIMPARISP